MNSLFIKETNGSMEEIGQKLESVIKENKFGILGIYNLKQKMKEKGVEFGPECIIYDICNPYQAKNVLENDLSVSTVLPCRISLYQESGKVKIATLRPTALVSMFDKGALDQVAHDVEEVIIKIMETAAK